MIANKEWTDACARVTIDNILPLYDKRDVHDMPEHMKDILCISTLLKPLVESSSKGFYLCEKQTAGLLKMKINGTLSKKTFDELFVNLWNYGRHVWYNLLGECNGNPLTKEVDIMDHEFAELYWSLLKE